MSSSEPNSEQPNVKSQFELAAAYQAKKRARTNLYFWAQCYWKNHKGEYLDFEQHAYLKGIYKDNSPDITIKKAAQLGFSEYALARSVFVADMLGGNVGYYFPAEKQVYDHVQTRVDPVFESVPYLNKITARAGLQGRGKMADKMSLKKIRNAFIMFRGAQNPRQVTSTPLDFAVLDEFDRFEGLSISMIEKRLLHSKLHWLLNLSTPTHEGRGIDLEIQQTDQMQWHVTCKHCKREQTLSYWNNVDEKEAMLVCGHCKKQMTSEDLQQGSWKPLYPNRTRRGYVVSGLLNPYLNLTKLIERMNSYNEFVVQEAYNQDLGIPYKSQNSTITDAQLDACQGKHTIPHVKHAKDALFAGVDVGRVSYMWVGRWNKELKKVEVVGIHELRNLETDLPYHMDWYDIRCCVIDALPETNLVTKLVNRYSGRLFAAHYDYHTINGEEYLNWHKEGGAVSVHRTASLDELFGRIRAQQILLPKHAKYIRGLYDQLKNQDRVLQMIGKQEMYVYVDNGKPDHYAHAGNYMLIASKNMPAEFVHTKKDDTMSRKRMPSELSTRGSTQSVFNNPL